MNAKSPDFQSESSLVPRLVQVPGSFLRLRLPPAVHPVITPTQQSTSKRIIRFPLAHLLSDEKARAEFNQQNSKPAEEKPTKIKGSSRVRFQDQRRQLASTPPSHCSVIVHDTPKGILSPATFTRHLSPTLRTGRLLHRDADTPSLQQWQEKWEDREQQVLLDSIKELNDLLAALRSRSKSPMRERGNPNPRFHKDKVNRGRIVL